MPRQIWTDRILEQYNGSYLPHIELSPEGLVTLKNTVAQVGTLHNSGMMNNLANTDTPIGFSNTNFKVDISADTITYTVTDKSGGANVVKQSVTGLSTGNLIITDELYNSGMMIQQRKMTLNINTMAGDVT